MKGQPDQQQNTARIEESRTFMTAFQNEVAADFVRRMMIHNYSEGIAEHHPASGTINKNDILEKCTDLVDMAYKKLNAIKDPKYLFPLFYQLSRKNAKPDPLWFSEFDDAYENYKHNTKMFIRLEQLKPFLHGESFCDIGCGGGDLIYFLKDHHFQFREYAGIDVLDWRTEHLKNSINFQMLDLSQPGVKSKAKYDTLTCIAVLHHVGNTDESRSIFLENLKSATSDNGRIIIEEDVILPMEEVMENDYFLEQVKTEMRRSLLFEEFMNLMAKDQRDAIIIIDFLANSLSGGVPEMAFPCGFKSVNEWVELFVSNGYAVEDVKIQGFKKGIFNRSSHVFFILRPLSK